MSKTILALATAFTIATNPISANNKPDKKVENAQIIEYINTLKNKNPFSLISDDSGKSFYHRYSIPNDIYELDIKTYFDPKSPIKISKIQVNVYKALNINDERKKGSLLYKLKDNNFNLTLDTYVDHTKKTKDNNPIKESAKARYLQNLYERSIQNLASRENVIPRINTRVGY